MMFKLEYVDWNVLYKKYLEDNLANVILGVEVAKGDTILMNLESKTKIIIAKIVKPKIVWKNSL